MAGTGEIADLVKRLEVMTTPEWRASLSRQLAEQTLQLIDDGFKNERDPYGSKWEKTQQPNQILQKTGQLRRSFAVTEASADGFVVGTSVSYAKYHQEGTRRLDQRPMLPHTRVLPEKWVEAYDRAVIRYVKETLR